MPETTLQPSTVPNPQPSLQKPTRMAKTAPEKPEHSDNKVDQPHGIQTTSDSSEMISMPSWEGVPVDMIRYFGQNLGTIEQRTIEQLRDINEWSKSDLVEDTIGNRLQKIRGLDSRLGAPNLHETKIQKMWNWVAMQKNINELRKRQEAFER